MFGLMMSEDRISLQNRRQEIISGLQSLPGMLFFPIHMYMNYVTNLHENINFKDCEYNLDACM